MKKYIRFVLYIIAGTMPCLEVVPAEGGIRKPNKESKAQFLIQRAHGAFTTLQEYVHCLIAKRDCSKARKVAVGAMAILLLGLYGRHLAKQKEESEDVTRKYWRSHEKYMRKSPK